MEITKNTLHIADYVVMGVMLLGSSAVGIYFAFRTTKKLSTRPDAATFGSSHLDDYLLGSRKMSVFPVAMSLVASYVSAVTVIGTPTEIYYFGSQYWMIIFPIILMGFVISFVYLPVFLTLQLNSSYQYLELRFNYILRSMASFMFVADEVLFLPMVVYVPSITFHQVTGFDYYFAAAVLVCVCVFYTLLGGIKAVMHTDVWQVIVMYVAVMAVVVMGTVYVGGPGSVFSTAERGGRLVFADVDPSKKYSFWSVIIGGFFYWTGFNSVNQTMVQRYLSLPSKKKAQGSVLIFTIGMSLFLSVVCYAGLLIYTFYENCDPIKANLVAVEDQIFPLFVMQVVGKYPGLPGLFLAGVFGAALSSLSVILNSTSLVIYEDIFKSTFGMNMSEKLSHLMVKGCIVILGGTSFCLVFVVNRIGTVLQVATTVTSISAACTFGMFSLGMLNPWCNNIGAIVGTVVGYLITAWIAFGSSTAIANHQVAKHYLPLSVTGCSGNSSLSSYIDEPDESNVFILYRLSYLWFTMIGFFIVIITGSITSFLTGSRDLKNIDPDLISPVIHRFLPKEVFTAEGRAKDSLTR